MRTLRHPAALALAFLLAAAFVSHAHAESWHLLDRDGRPVAYVDVDRDLTIYLWGGEPVAYLHDDGHPTHHLVYAFDGTHLGWYQDAIVWNLAGDGVGFREGTQSIATVPAGPKGVKRILPLRSVRSLPRSKPALSYRFSATTLEAFLGATPRESTAITTASATYAAAGQRHGIRRVEERGAIVVLMDGSRWEVSSLDRLHTMLWLPAVDVRVDLARNPVGSYRYALTHVRDERTVLARYLGR